MRSVATALDSLLGAVVEILAAALVAAEIVILFSGVVARYVLNHPLIWSDELASILFLWLAMLGAVIAFRRDEHMRMTAAVGSLPAPTRMTFDLFATCAALAFLLLIARPAFEYAQEETFITTPALGLNNAWRAAALPSGIALMAVFAVLRVSRAGSLRSVAISLCAVAALVALFWLAGPLFLKLGNLNLLIFFVGVVAATVFAGVPIAFAFGLAIFGYLALTTHTPLLVLIGRMDEGMSHLILLAVPLFVFLGLLIEMTGMARAMVAFLANLLGHVRGGLHYVLVAAMYLVSGISGAKAADMAAVAPVLFPEMKARGAKPGDLVALLAATGAQTETIPPSLVLITIGSVTGVSIAALFTGGLLPGVVLAILLCFVVRRRYRRENLGDVKRATARDIGRTFVIALPALALPFLIRAAVVEGVATATEVSTIGIVYSAIVGLVDLPPLRLGGAQTDAGLDRMPVGRDPAHYRHGDRNGMGPDAIGFFALARDRDDRAAGRRIHLHGGVDRGLCRARLRARRHSRHRAVRAAFVSHRQGRRHPRGALRHGRHSCHGHRALRAAVRRRLLRRLRHRPRRAGRRHAADLGLHAGPRYRHDRRSGRAVDLDRLPEMINFAARG